MDDKKFKSQMKKLKQAFKEGEKFVLFVGAGQNGGANMRLMWHHLIGDVSKISFRQLFQELDVNIKDSHAIMEAIGIYSNNGKSEEAKNAKDTSVKFHESKNISEQDKRKEDKEDRTNSVIDEPQTTKEEIDPELMKYINLYFPIEIQVSMIKSLMKDHYIPALQQKLYNECNYREIKKSFWTRYKYKIDEDTKRVTYIRYIKDEVSTHESKELYTLFTIARMILLNPQIESAITFNFDNFIRQAVRVLLKYRDTFFSSDEIEFIKKRFWFLDDKEESLHEKVLVKDIHDNGISRSKNVGLFYFPVYHVHGYIPDPEEEEIVETPHIVMALEEFVEQQTEGLSWQDSVQINAFRNANIIFIGCSMTDLTMKRMINFAHTNGYTNKIFILSARNPKSNENSSTQMQIDALEKVREKYFEELGATYITHPGEYNDLCDALCEITYPNLHPEQL